MSQHSPRVHKWSDSEVERLIRLIETGVTFRDLVMQLGCTEGELEREALYLGVLLPQHEPIAVATQTANSTSAGGQPGVMHFAPGPARPASD